MSEHREVKQMRPVDQVGLLGVVMTALGAAFFMTSQTALPLWAKWLVGPLCWYLGFALMLVWALMRCFRSQLRVTNEAEEPATKSQRAGIRVSNFLEHDYESVA